MKALNHMKNDNNTIYLKKDCSLRESLGAKDPNFKVTTLTNVEDFVRIIGDNKILYYGGDQLWYGRDTVGHCGGCGSVAVANILIYLAKREAKNKELYNYELDNISKPDFTNYMKDIYEYVKPQEIKLPFVKPILIGKPSSLRVAREAKTFAFSKGIDLKSNSCNNILKGFDSIVDFIRASLLDDNPVAMLIWYNKKLKDIDFLRANGSVTKEEFQLHWVTITGLAENKITGDKYILVSSWGGKAIINLKDAYSGGAMFLFNLII